MKIKELNFPSINLDLLNSSALLTLNNKKVTPFSKEDYQLPFLFYICNNFQADAENKSLSDLIDKYISSIKDQLNFKDIELTKTGVTRCKTNVRFAIKALREYGLIYMENKNKPLNWQPTFLAFLVIILLTNKKLLQNTDLKGIKVEKIFKRSYFNGYYSDEYLHPLLLKAIRDLSIVSELNNLIKLINHDIIEMKINYLTDLKKLLQQINLADRSKLIDIIKETNYKVSKSSKEELSLLNQASMFLNKIKNT